VQQPLDLAPSDMAEVARLVARFHRAFEEQQKRDDAILAGLVRALRRGGADADHFAELIRSHDERNSHAEHRRVRPAR
jgi:hypothetical protein